MQGEKSDDGAGEGIREGEGETERVEEIEGDEQRENIVREGGDVMLTHHWTEETF